MCRKFPTVGELGNSSAKTQVRLLEHGPLKTRNEDLYNQHSLHQSANNDYKLLHLIENIYINHIVSMMCRDNKAAYFIS